MARDRPRPRVRGGLPKAVTGILFQRGAVLPPEYTDVIRAGATDAQRSAV